MQGCYALLLPMLNGLIVLGQKHFEACLLDKDLKHLLRLYLDAC